MSITIMTSEFCRTKLILEKESIILKVLVTQIAVAPVQGLKIVKFEIQLGAAYCLSFKGRNHLLILWN